MAGRPRTPKPTLDPSLRGVLVASSVVWADGVPVEAELAWQKKPADRERSIGTAALASLRALHLGKPNTGFPIDWLERFLFAPPLRGLRELTSLPAALLPALATSAPPWALERVHTVGGRPPLADEVARAFADGAGLPALTELTLTFTAIGNHPHLYEWLATTAIGRRLRALTIAVDWSHLVPWATWLVERGDAIGLERLAIGHERSVTGRAHDWIALVREHGRWSALIGRVGHPRVGPPGPKRSAMRAHALAQLDAEIAKLPRGIADRVERLPEP